MFIYMKYMCLYTWNTGIYVCVHEIFPDGSVVKNLSANAGDAGGVGLIPGSGRSPGGGKGNPLQNSCLENPMDRGAWWATVHSVAKSWTWLKQLSTAQHIYIHTHIYVIAQSWKNKNKSENFSEILEISIYSYPRIAECKMELKPSVLII